MFNEESLLHLDFLLTSKIYLKEHPPSTSIVYGRCIMYIHLAASMNRCMCHSLTKEGQLLTIRPSPSFALISNWGLKIHLKECPPRASIANRNSHCLTCLRMWWDWFTHTTRYKLHCCTVVYTNTRCLSPHCHTIYALLWVLPPCLSLTQGAPPMGLLSQDNSITCVLSLFCTWNTYNLHVEQM